MKKFLVLLTGGILLFSPINSVFSVGISPIIYDDIVVNPGDIVIKEMRVYNNTDRIDTYYFYTKNFVPVGEEGQQIYRDTKNDIGLASWVKPEVEKIVLKPWEEKKIKFTITTPLNAEPGGHYAAFFASKNPPTEFETNEVGLGSEVGLLLLVKVNGDIKEQANIKEFGIVKEKSHWNRLPITFFTRVENQGNIHFKPQGTIEIKSLWGSKTTIPANPIQGNVLPASIRRLESVWQKNNESEDTKNNGFIAELKNEWNNFAIGRYKATLNLSWSTNNPPLTATKVFWVFPWHVMLVGLLIIVVFILFLKGYNKLVVARARALEKK